MVLEILQTTLQVFIHMEEPSLGLETVDMPLIAVAQQQLQQV